MENVFTKPEYLEMLFKRYIGDDGEPIVPGDGADWIIQDWDKIQTIMALKEAPEE